MSLDFLVIYHIINLFTYLCVIGFLVGIQNSDCVVSAACVFSWETVVSCAFFPYSGKQTSSLYITLQPLVLWTVPVWGCFYQHLEFSCFYTHYLKAPNRGFVLQTGLLLLVMFESSCCWVLLSSFRPCQIFLIWLLCDFIRFGTLLHIFGPMNNIYF